MKAKKPVALRIGINQYKSEDATIRILACTIRPVTDLPSAGVKANKLIASVGGPSKICDEANQMFRRFSVTNVKFFHDSSELKDYPSIAALGPRCTPLPPLSLTPPFMVHFMGV